VVAVMSGIFGVMMAFFSGEVIRTEEFSGY
jgi:hypothetical protein